MPAPPPIPPALLVLADLVAGFARRAPSARVAVTRAGGILEPEALPPVLRRPVARAVAAASEASRVALPFAKVERALKLEWRRPVGRVLDALEEEPLALTPAAQVHAGVLDGAPVVVKLRRAGVERALRADLAVLDVLGPALSAAFPRLDAGALLRDARELALDEVDLEHEASQQRRAARALRDVAGVRVPAPVAELTTPEVFVMERLPGATLASGARPEDRGAAARALIAAARTLVLEAGFVPVDLRASHVLVAEDGTLGLLGMGVGRPVDRARATSAFGLLAALASEDEERFAAILAEASVLPPAAARASFVPVHALLGPLLGEPCRLDAAALRALIERAGVGASELLPLGQVGSPRPEDLWMARALGQLVAVLSRLEATEDWAALLAS